VFSTLGNTCVAFVAGALAMFATKFMYLAYQVQGLAYDEQTNPDGTPDNM